MKKNVVWALMGVALIIALSSILPACKAKAAKSEAAVQEQIAAEVARQVAEQLSSAGVKETSQPPAKEAALDGAAEAERLAAEKAAAEQAEAARLTVEKAAAEQAEAERLAAEKEAAEKAAAEKAKAAAAPKYAIGAKGPGGGVVFSAAGGTFKEVSPVVGTINEIESNERSLILDVVKAYQSNGFSGWSLPSLDELKQIYELQKSGKVNFKGKLILSKTSRYSQDLVFGNADFPEFPGYRIILAGGGPTTYYGINFSTGAAANYMPGEGNKDFSFVAVRSFK